jgi:hypothetical protein
MKKWSNMLGIFESIKLNKKSKLQRKPINLLTLEPVCGIGTRLGNSPLIQVSWKRLISHSQRLE